MNKIWFCLAVVLMVVFSSCKTYRDTQGNKVPRRTAEDFRAALDSSRFEFENFSTRINLDYRDKIGRESGFVHIRMQKDSLIWISMRKLSIEGARILISPDSVHILDRTNKQYIPISYSALMDNYGLDLSFSQLQDLIVGNPLAEMEGEYETGWEGNFYFFRAQLPGYTHEFWLNPATLLAARMKVTEAGSGRSMEVSADSYEEVSGQWLAVKRKIVFSAGDLAELELSYAKNELDVDNLNFDFNVNPRYKVILGD